MPQYIYDLIQSANSLSSHEHDTFLNPKFNDVVKNHIQQTFSSLSKKNKKQRFKFLRDRLPFLKTFENKGINGIAGLCNATIENGSNVPIVYKISVNIDESISHEFDVALSLNSMRTFCPHFSYVYDNVSLPISRNYIDMERIDNLESDEEECWEDDDERLSIWDEDSDTIQTKLLFYEFVSDVGLYYLYKYSCKEKDIKIPLSQMLMVLAGLEMAQTHTQFTHYDLHIDNILIRPCEDNSFFFYRFATGETCFIPTFGFFPVCIDFGNSYSESLDGKKVRTSIANYHNGVQPITKDKINDIHHFILSSICYLESKNEYWRQIATKCFITFGHLPVWRYKGWKKLPYSVLDKAVEGIELACKSITNYSLWNEYTLQILELLTMITDCPWADHKDYSQESREKDLNNLECCIAEFQQIDDDPDLVHSRDSLVCLKIMIDMINSGKNENEVGNWKSAVHSFYKVPKTFKVKECFEWIRSLKQPLEHLFYEYFIINCQVRDNIYEKIDVKCPYHMIQQLQKWTSLKVESTPNSKVYIWDACKQQRKIVTIGDKYNGLCCNNVNRLIKEEFEKQNII
jgi:hypothetical protein